MDVGITKLKEMWKRSIENPHEFWSPIAEELYWAKKWDKVLDDSNPPFYR